MNLLYNMSSPGWTFRCNMFTLAMIFLPQGVIILQHEIFTPLHWGKYIMALNFHLLKNITASNIRSSSRGENIIPSNIYPFHEVRILYCQIFTPFPGMRIEKYWIFTPFAWLSRNSTECSPKGWTFNGSQIIHALFLWDRDKMSTFIYKVCNN